MIKYYVSLLLLSLSFSFCYPIKIIPYHEDDESFVGLEGISDPSEWELSPLFSTEFLLNSPGVQTYLKAEGFHEITIKTPDNLLLTGLFLERPNASYNVLLCAGFCPGKKEGMATFFKIFDDQCNMLFFDARGHGKSDGSFLSTLPNYGQNEYKDVIGCLDFLNQKNDLPIILSGVCSGSFHSAHALLKLPLDKTTYNIKGIIFDSGWNSIASIGKTTPHEEAQKNAGKIFKFLYRTNRRDIIESGILYRLVRWMFSSMLAATYWLFFENSFKKTDEQWSLEQQISNVPVPICFIHAANDSYAALSEVELLMENAPEGSQKWIVPASRHACIHLKNKWAYTKVIRNFCTEVLALDQQ